MVHCCPLLDNNPPSFVIMIQAVIIDDEQKSIDTLSKVIETFTPHVEVAYTTTHLQEGYTFINAHQPALVFLDIEMGGYSGFDLLELFDEINFHLIFVSAYEEFALKAIKFSALDYLLKPVNPAELKNAIKKVEQLGVRESEGRKVKQMLNNFLTNERGNHKITLATFDGFEFVEIDNILYCKADGSYTHFHLKNGQKITTSKNLKFYADILIEYGFYRNHSATLINLRFIKRYSKSDGGYLIMVDGSELSISKSRKAGLLETLSLN